jgi:hypothetical protein
VTVIGGTSPPIRPARVDLSVLCSVCPADVATWTGTPLGMIRAGSSKHFFPVGLSGSRDPEDPPAIYPDAATRDLKMASVHSIAIVLALAATASAFSPSVSFSKPSLQTSVSTKHGSSVFSSRSLPLRTEPSQQVHLFVARRTGLKLNSVWKSGSWLTCFLIALWQSFVTASKFQTALSATIGIDFPVVILRRSSSWIQILTTSIVLITNISSVAWWSCFILFSSSMALQCVSEWSLPAGTRTLWSVLISHS